jgi:hypothetical protein
LIRREHRVEIAEIAREREPALAGVALEVADAVHALISDCTAAVVIVGGPEWQMLAQVGPDDLSFAWRRLVADTWRVGDPANGVRGAFAAPLRSTLIGAMLVAAPQAGTSLPSAARRIVRPLLDAGGIQLDATLSDVAWVARGGIRLVTDSRVTPTALARRRATPRAGY